MDIVERPAQDEWETVSWGKENLITSLTMDHADPPEQASIDNSCHQRHVSFGVVEIREYPIILGDHPSAKSGVPLAIDWGYEEGETMSVVEYDAIREPNHRGKRMRQMRMSPYYRRILLKELQYSGTEVKEREKEMLKIQRQRATTKFFVRIRKFEEKFKKSIAKGNCLANKKTVPVMDDADEKSFGPPQMPINLTARQH